MTGALLSPSATRLATCCQGRTGSFGLDGLDTSYVWLHFQNNIIALPT